MNYKYIYLIGHLQKDHLNLVLSEAFLPLYNQVNFFLPLPPPPPPPKKKKGLSFPENIILLNCAVSRMFPWEFSNNFQKV